MQYFGKYTCLLITAVLVVAGCKKSENVPIEKSSVVPEKVKDITVINQAGKALISYTVPKDPNFFYVKAMYKASSGLSLEAKSSYFDDTIRVEGFADTLEHEVRLYSMSRSNISSEPVVVKVKPGEAPIWSTFRSIDIQSAFGGYDLKAVNKEKADISILVFKKNFAKEFEVDNDKSVFTSTDSIFSNTRGLDTISYTFGFLVQDKWGNRTDTMFKNIKPFYEIEIPKDHFAAFRLPGDGTQASNGSAVQYMWDNQLGWPWTSFIDQFTSPPGPSMVTFEIGTLAKLSRIKIIPYPEGANYYYLTTMKRFEIYGSVKPNLNGMLDNSWSLLGSYSVKKPSGAPYGQDTDEDRAVASAGLSWDIDINAPKVRYIRIRCLENFAGGTAQNVNELYVYGDPR